MLNNFLYLDEEQESITISTNEELEIALEEMGKNNPKNYFKLYIKVYRNEEGRPDMTNIEKISHPGIICDICEKYIHGFRFKCMQCVDYDLCTDCMMMGNHHDHYLVRMTEPIDWSSRDGRRLFHHMRKFVKKTQHNKDNDERKWAHRNGKRSGCPFNATSGKVGPFDPSIINSLADFVIDVCAAPSDENHEQKRSKEQHRDPSAEAATEATEDSQEATRHSFSQLLKIVEDNLSNISQFLDPLGINVTVMTDKDSTKNKPTEAKVNTQKPENSSSTSEDSTKKFPGEGKTLHNETAITTNEKITPLSDTTSTQKKEPTACATEQAAEAEEWTLLQNETSNISRTASTSSTSSSLNETTPKQVRFAKKTIIKMY